MRHDFREVMVGSLAVVPAAPSEDPRPPKGGPATTDLLAVVNVALAGVGGVYLTTRSVLVTLIAAVSAVILAGLASLVR
jgi:hypothetical protein